MSDKKILVLYHGPTCADGYCSAWVAWRHYGAGAEYRPINYGDPVPDDAAGKFVFLLDFAFNTEDELRRLASFASHLVVIDHHKSSKDHVLAMQDPYWKEKVTAIHNVTKSGAQLTWNYFFKDFTEPWLVRYTADRDLWKFELLDSKAVSAWIASHPFGFDLWQGWNDQIKSPDDRGGLGESVWHSPWADLVNEGKAILRYQEQRVQEAVKNAVLIRMGEHRVLCANATNLISEIGERLAENKPFGATFFVRGDGKFVYSLRSRPPCGIDVSQVAKLYGGGGHAGAAGFLASGMFMPAQQ